jgi:hypothetical protein
MIPAAQQLEVSVRPELPPLRASRGVVLLGLVLIAAAWITRASGNVVDLDLWHELALARETVRLAHVPHGDLFAYTPTVTPSVNHEWGAGLLAYAVLAAGGTGLVLWNLALAGGALSLAVACAWSRRADPCIVAIAGIVAMPMMALGLAPVRAQAYSFLFFASLLYAIERDRQGVRWAIPAWCPVFLLWVNVHGSFVLAFVPLAWYWLYAVLRRRPSVHIAAAALAMAALICASPYGTAMYSHLWRTLRMSRPFIDEWGPIWSGKFVPLLRPLVLSIAVCLYAIWITSRGKASAET